VLWVSGTMKRHDKKMVPAIVARNHFAFLMLLASCGTLFMIV
jgi:hypothetical protein